jgi:hypothetical protein
MSQDDTGQTASAYASRSANEGHPSNFLDVDFGAWEPRWDVGGIP